jgi:hypothetical protein
MAAPRGEKRPSDRVPIAIPRNIKREEQMRTSVFATLAIAVGLFGASQAYADIDVTGTYTVSRSCKGMDAGDPAKSSEKDLEMTVTQTGTDVNVQFSGAPHYGKIQPLSTDVENKGTASMVSCAVSNDLDYVGADTYNRLGKLDFKAKGDAISFKGSYFDGAAIGQNFILFCKVKGVRTSNVNPLVPVCAP